jgi:Met-10+ like-protein
MNLFRFIRKCLTDPPAAASSAKLVGRGLYGCFWWTLYPITPLAHHLPTGGVLLLEPNHCFTGCFWPDVDHYEPDVCAFLRDFVKPGFTFIDCGANVGHFSIMAAGLVGGSGVIVAIEANPHTYQLLARNLNKNNVGTSIHCASQRKTGEVELFMPPEGDVYCSLR